MYTHGLSSPCEKTRRSQSVQNMVRHIVNDLESLQSDLTGVVSDLKGLVNDIDSVTNKIEKKYGPKRHSLCHVPLSSVQVSEPRKIHYRKSQPEEIKYVDESPDLDLSYLHITPGWQRPQWGRSLSFPSSVLRTPESQTKQEFRCDFNATTFIPEIPLVHEQSLSPPPTAKCFAQIKEEETSEVNEAESNEKSLDCDDFRRTTNSDKSITVEDVCQKIIEDIDMNVLSETEVEEQNSATKSTVSSEGTYKEIVHINTDKFKKFQSMPLSDTTTPSVESTEYDGIYETVMEKELENLSEPSVESYHSELSDSNMDFGSFGKSNSSASDDIEARYDRNLNTWKSYTLSHRTASSESLNSNFSDTPSDILNDNTRATAIYGNMIFSDNLVLIHSKRKQKRQLTF